MISALTAVTMLIFSLLYTPCVATIASIKRELGRSWAAGVAVWQCVLAWIVAYLFTLLMGII
jgi:ferrous iron transport protein B